MAKNDPKTYPAALDAAITDTNAATSAATPGNLAAPPALGTLVHVKVAEGCMLVNNETGAYFCPNVATPVTVTTTLLRRLLDGDVTLAG